MFGVFLELWFWVGNGNDDSEIQGVVLFKEGKILVKDLREVGTKRGKFLMFS